MIKLDILRFYKAIYDLSNEIKCGRRLTSACLLACLQAVDVLLNNWDRLPLVWANEGNAANLMRTAVGGHTHGLWCHVRKCD